MPFGTDVTKEGKMKLKYFADTDTAFIEFNNSPIEETFEISENLLADFDKEGNMVSMTIEHAQKNAQLHEFAFEQMEAASQKENI